MNDVKNYNTFIKIEPINKGWSGDKKYYIETKDFRKLLLRIAGISEYNRKKAEFGIMKQIAALDIPMSQPVDFGTCNGGESVYTMLTWCEGDDAEAVLPLMTETEQYALGLKSGEYIRKIHSLPAPAEQEEWASRFNRKTSIKINKYKACGYRFEGDDYMIDYLENNRNLLENRPQCLQHGDYHVGNMVISPDGKLFIIDFNRFDYGDPWEEFNRIVWSAAVSPYFATGQLNGYFGGKPPLEFFKLLAFYIASNSISSIYWAVPFGKGELETMLNQTQDVLSWFDNFNNPVPTWYKRDIYIQYIDGIPYRLKSPFDMSFISKYGKVFNVFDDQDSGNICFGVQDGEKRYFIKFAGAQTVRYLGTAGNVITRLKASEPVYRELTHPNLIKFIKAEEVGGGYALIFEWTDGECMGRMYPLSRSKFLQLPVNKKLGVYDDILAFHDYVIKQGYVAVDFYDGSIMYDFKAGKTVICDIDLYAKRPYINTMGRMYGSSRFMSPEEFILGAEIDEVSNVYLMGATAFALFTDYDRTPDKWQLNKKLYDTAFRAVNNDRSKRQQSIQQFIDEWNEVKD